MFRGTVRVSAWILLTAAVIVVCGGAALAEPDAKSIIINPNQPYQTEIWTDRARYELGDKVTVYFRSNKDAYVYIFDIDTTGTVSLIFPNIYSDSNYRRANQTYLLPDNSRYNLTVGGPAGTEQLVLIATPSRISDVDWLRRSLEQGSFGPQLNVNISAEKFMLEVKSVTVTPNFGQNYSSAVTTFTVGRGSVLPPPPPPPPAPVTRGVLSVTSQPSGAQVFLDGVEQGKTPITISGISYGAHEINVVKKNYYMFSRQVSVNSPNAYQIHASLAKLPNNDGRDNEIPLTSRTINVKWPNTGPFTEVFSYSGSSGNLMITGDPVLGMISRVTATLTVNAVGPIQFADLAPKGADAPWPGRVFEKVQYPFKARITVEDYSIVTGPVFGVEYIDYLRLRVDTWYIGD
ncbi:MAG: DUF4384 domain-containing protein [Clostridia bacterium]|nr:DUF4384 domain-containing protein [Clostridia bacterium]